ncbi:glycosyltransferase WbuB [Cryobacterium melibiosiphilum]|uniref:D-inositol 3-phosphate glycosyltransferase n=1 Tax=Cryobacterium melibiosiphilum TaxID=995039 RepID=A0A3A5MT59_9MICO|nr:glycosyltransferase [Cryobacterium melibiosiphilum]RJT91029.1 glycosyltransferase WbuB [Cryobacterium melibiosiphilum]
MTPPTPHTTRPLRILILGLHYTPESTGNAPYTSALAEGLTARGHQVRVITAHPHYPEWRIRPGYGAHTSHETINNVPVTRLAHYVPPTPTNLQRLLSELSFGLRLMTTRWARPDVLLLVSPALFSTALALTRARLLHRRLPVGIWVQDLYSLGLAETGTGGGRATALMRRIESATLRHATSVAVIHDRFKLALVTKLNVKHTTIHVIRNWTHLPEPPAFDRVQVRKTHGWLDTDTIVLHAGNMGVKQGLENVVEAARLADEQQLPVRFVLLGNGNQRARLEQQGTNISRLQFLEGVPDADFQATLGSADILLVNELPGVTEMSVPSKLTSYFSTGLPVLGATDPTSVTAGELALSGGGVQVNAGDPAALLAAVRTLAADPARQNTLGAAGLTHCRSTLSATAAVTRFDYWLQSLNADSDQTPTARLF